MFQENLTKSVLQSSCIQERMMSLKPKHKKKTSNYQQITTTSTYRAVRGAGAADGDIDVAKPGMAEQLGSLQLDETALGSDSIS